MAKQVCLVLPPGAQAFFSPVPAAGLMNLATYFPGRRSKECHRKLASVEFLECERQILKCRRPNSELRGSQGPEEGSGLFREIWVEREADNVPNQQSFLVVGFFFFCCGKTYIT